MEAYIRSRLNVTEQSPQVDDYTLCATLSLPPLIFVEMEIVSLHARVHRNLKEVAVFRHSSKKVNKEDGTVLYLPL